MREIHSCWGIKYHFYNSPAILFNQFNTLGNIFETFFKCVQWYQNTKKCSPKDVLFTLAHKECYMYYQPIAPTTHPTNQPTNPTQPTKHPPTVYPAVRQRAIKWNNVDPDITCNYSCMSWSQTMLVKEVPGMNTTSKNDLETVQWNRRHA